MQTSARWARRTLPWLAVMSLSASAATLNRHAAETYIVEAERGWALAVASGDATVVERIVAEDFVGVAPDGALYGRQQAIADTRTSAKQFVSNHLLACRVRFFGTTAIAQGEESWVRRSGDHRHGKFVWTDTWILRNGQWQVVAAEDVTVLDPGG
jgi:hypothetical protein